MKCAAGQRCAAPAACSSSSSRAAACRPGAPLGLPALARPCCRPAGLAPRPALRGARPCSGSGAAPCGGGLACSAAAGDQQFAAAVPTAAAAAGAGAAQLQQQQQQQQQQSQQRAGAGAAPFAALSRVLLNANGGVFRNALSGKRQPVSGPMGLLLFLLTLLAASFAAIRGALLKRTKKCRSCRGFGLQRCRLCLGSGRVDWAAKLKHFDVCPLCMNRRFIVCAECGGHYHRPMFSHRRRTAGGALEPSAQQPSAAPPSVEGPIVLTAAMAGAGAPGQILSALSD
ncbi:hypothetical protein HT031_002980 [Scenedesmus sp. PABB004]|nr:hypothetical protein HT031_002980 [Scenedesmus sp. PABB004]